MCVIQCACVSVRKVRSCKILCGVWLAPHYCRGDTHSDTELATGFGGDCLRPSVNTLKADSLMFMVSVEDELAESTNHTSNSACT